MSGHSLVFELTSDLIRRVSVTPDDAGCQAVLAARLATAGFQIEQLRYGEVDNLWATHGRGRPVFVLLGHTDVVPSGPEADWTSPRHAQIPVRNAIAAAISARPSQVDRRTAHRMAGSMK